MFIREKGLLGGVSTEARGIIESHKTRQTYKEGDLIFKEGEEAGHLYMLDDGKVDLLVGKPQETRFLAYYPGEVFGWSALLRPHRYLSTARCMTQSAVSRISIEAIRRIVKDYPEDGILIYQNLARILGERLIEAYRDRQAEPKQVTYGG
jgi:CRP-like cAMP-binding protein